MKALDAQTARQIPRQAQDFAGPYLSYLQTSFDFVRLMFSQPLRLNKRVTRCTQAEARVLGKMAKVWYIKKKIKKLSKKLKNKLAHHCSASFHRNPHLRALVLVSESGPLGRPAARAMR